MFRECGMPVELVARKTRIEALRFDSEQILLQSVSERQVSQVTVSHQAKKHCAAKMKCMDRLGVKS